MAWELVEDQPKAKSFGESALDVGKDVARNIARTGSNIATRAVGLPGDVLSMGNALGNYISDQNVPYEETFIGKGLPTTETHRRRLSEGTGGYLAPQNKIEKFADDVIEDFALLAIPGGKALKGASKVRPLAISLGSNLVGEGVEQLTEDKTKGSLAKAGTMFLSTLINPKLAMNKYNELYGNAEKAIQGATHDATGLTKELSSIRHSITKGRPEQALSKAEKFVLDSVDKVLSLIDQGQFNVSQLWNQKKSLYSDMDNLFVEFGKKPTRTIRNEAKKVTNAINNSLKDYGKTNKEFYKNFKDADEIYGTVAQSQGMQNWVKRNIKKAYIVGSVVGLPSLFGMSTALKAGAGAAGAVSANEIAKITYKISKSPALRKLYGNALQSAAKEDAAAFNKYFSQLDDKLKEDESKEKWEFID